MSLGDPGTNGTDGVPGVNGTNGVPGVNGTDGVPGINGTDGVPGVDGMDGVPGPRGKHLVYQRPPLHNQLYINNSCLWPYKMQKGELMLTTSTK